MPRVFGRNNPEVDPKTAYRMETERVLAAVTISPEHLAEIRAGVTRIGELAHSLPGASYQELGAKEYEPYWGTFDSVFQQAAFEGIYPDIFEELCKINDRVTFDNRN